MNLAVASSAWLSGAFGLGGVALGGLMSFLSTRGVERRREARESLQTMRLANAELGGQVFGILDDALKYRSWPAGWQSATWSESWGSYRQVLAATLAYEDFETIAKPYQRMVALQSGLAAGKRKLDGGREPTQADDDQAAADPDRVAAGEQQPPAGQPGAADQRAEPDRVFLSSLRTEVEAARDLLETLVASRESKRLVGRRPWPHQR